MLWENCLNLLTNKLSYFYKIVTMGDSKGLCIEILSGPEGSSRYSMKNLFYNNELNKTT